jgi:serine/threonine protein kinase
MNQVSSQCFNPDCMKKNRLTDNFCIYCGNKLLLRERYRPIHYLGEGGFVRTFVALDQDRRNTKSVIKQFLPFQQGSEALQKCKELFDQEAELLDKLGKHPQIPDLLAFFEQDQRLYLVQEFIEGQDLLKELQQKGRFSETEVKSFLLEMLPVLDFIHQKKVIHRDIKPENIIRRKTPLDPHIHGHISNLVLIDFGVSKQITTVMSRLGTGVGTPGYAPPEQSRGMVNNSSDLYSLAVTAIRLLTGIVPKEINGSAIDELFDLDGLCWVWKEFLQQENISINSDFAQVLDKMLQDIPRDRYQDAKDVLAALQSPQKPPISSQIPVTQPTGQQHNITLQTAKADYHELDKLLAANNWKIADQETAKIMLKIMNREGQNYLREEDCKNCPKDELKILDSLWVHHSNGHFGFSVQKEIFTSAKIGGRLGKYDYNIWCKFGDKVGWRKNGSWLKNYDQLSFEILFNNKGHLPCVGGWRKFGFGLLFCSLISNL